MANIRTAGRVEAAWIWKPSAEDWLMCLSFIRNQAPFTHAHCIHASSSFLRSRDGGDGLRRERIGLHEDLLAGLADFRDDGVGAAAERREMAGDVGRAVARLRVVLWSVGWRSVGRRGVSAGGIGRRPASRRGIAETR